MIVDQNLVELHIEKSHFLINIISEFGLTFNKVDKLHWDQIGVFVKEQNKIKL